MRSIPQGPKRINSKSSGLRRASSLQDTKRQGAGDSPRDWVGWTLGRDGNNSFLNPDTWDIQVLSWSFMSLCTLHMPIHIKINSIINAFFCIELLFNFFACLCWLAPTLLAKLHVNFYSFQKEFVLASSNLFQSELKKCNGVI